MPAKLEDYEVLYTIGSGSYGKCKKIRRKSDGKVLVWKEMDYGKMTESEKQMLVSEVNLLRELKHKYIVRYFDRILDKSNTTIYLIMEHCEGGDLSTLISKCRRDRKYLEEAFIWNIFLQLTLALQECHRRDAGRAILHRDLKPANVFLDADHNVKLGDFGLARVLNHDHSFAKTFVGTPYYMSPEQVNYLSYNEKSDIWSLGCLLYELCALSPPFTALNQRGLSEKIREGKFRRIPSQYSDDLSEIIASMLKINDILRPSIEDLLKMPCLSSRKRESSSLELSNSLKRKEEALQAREKQVEEKEKELERKERELLKKEKMADEKLARAESLMKEMNGLKINTRIQEIKTETGAPEDVFPQFTLEESTKLKKKCPLQGKENEQTTCPSNIDDAIKMKELRDRLHKAKLRGIELRNAELTSRIKSRKLLGMR
ncbi:serine/threonine-protein kinase Nek2-like [Saccoglossus kowalevskii]|uniref:non-specific serine/threonine protein kinase n=1 Tax=Saccoglossus kowalevskii TaxID=10224 RepID=A0ABM0GJC1_SACKO|nr:PREDICTED: serine/threonine-protein kinase Nek2-like [Saccoglossus kowalevskii]